MRIQNTEVIDSNMKNKQKNILKSIGLQEFETSYDRTLNCFVVMKVLTPEEALVLPDKYMKSINEQNLKGKARQYEKNSPIWTFKIYL